MRRAGLLLLLLFCLLLCGCSGRELEEQLLVIILGIDKTETGETRVSVKVPSNSASSGGEAQQGGDQMGYLLLEATGPDFTRTMNLLQATTPRTLNFSQVREVVIGETAASGDDFAKILQSVYALPRMRAQAALIICRDQAYELVKAQRPYVGMRLSRYVDTTLKNYAGKGFVPDTTLGEAFRDLGYGFQDALLIYGAVNDFSAPQSGGPANPLDGQAGNLPRKSANPVEMLGAAATDGTRVSGTITGYEMGLVHLVRGDAKALDVQPEGEPATPVFARTPASLSVDLSCSPAVLRIDLVCEGRYFPGFYPDEEKLREKIEGDLYGLMARLQALSCDGLGFGNLAAGQCLTVQQWEALSFRDVYRRARVEITIRLQMREY